MCTKLFERVGTSYGTVARKLLPNAQRNTILVFGTKHGTVPEKLLHLRSTLWSMTYSLLFTSRRLAY